MTVTNQQTGIQGIIAWETEYEVGIDCAGFTWTGSREQFEREWRIEGVSA